MDNNQNILNTPPIQPAAPAPAPQPVVSDPAAAPAPAPQPYNGTGSMVAPAPDPNAPLELPKRRRRKTGHSPIILLVGLIVSILSTFTFIGLFIWMYLQYDEVHTDVQGQINQAVAEAVNDNTTKMEEEFLEREKEPNKTFTGPEDYGEVSFQYPKTWSVYIPSDASNGGNYQAYFSPNQVEAINNNNPNSLRLTISTQSFESMVRTYESYQNSGRMTMKVITIGGNPANLYTGTLPSNLSGAVCLIKIRDKTVTLQTDSELYMADFLKLLDTITYNS